MWTSVLERGSDKQRHREEEEKLESLQRGKKKSREKNRKETPDSLHVF
jgi:hypothetical protein